jgi:hypothetical protein
VGLAAALAGWAELEAAADLVGDGEADGVALGDADGLGDGLAGGVVTDTAGVGVLVAVASAAADVPPEPELPDEFPPLAIPENAQASRPITPSPATNVKNRRLQ